MYEKETWKERGKTKERRRYISVWLWGGWVCEVSSVPPLVLASETKSCRAIDNQIND